MEYNIVGEIYKNEIDTVRLEATVRLPPEFIKESNVLLLSDLINTFRMFLIKLRGWLCLQFYHNVTDSGQYGAK